jgi:peptide/nickel transport system substrate-binding protein
MRMKFFLGAAIGLPLAAGLLIMMALSVATAAEDDVEVYTMGDTTGDWGYPSPYAHYVRGPGIVRMSFIFDNLVWKDDEGRVPALAESWEMEGDDVFVFNLREGVTWHDGEPFDADDVIFTIDYNKDHPYPLVDSGIIDHAEKVDDYTVRIYLSKPYAPFLDQVAGTLPILPEHIWKDVDDPTNFLEDEALIGTGPYTLEDYDKVQGTYQYKAYDDYYLGSPKVKEIRYVKISAANAAASLMQGDVDAAEIQPEMMDSLSGFEILSMPEHASVYKLTINHQKEPMSEKRFRQALAYAIDRDELVEIVARGYGLAGSPGFIPPDNNWYNPAMDGLYPHDPAKAEELLEDMGYDGETVELLIKGGDTKAERIGELIEADLAAVGIDLELRTMDSKTIDSKVQDWDFDLAVNGHGGLIGDPNFLAFLTTSWDHFNSARYLDDDELTEVLEVQVREMDEDERHELVDRAQVLHAEDVPMLPLYYPDAFVAHDGKVDIYYTWNGIGLGTPTALGNKLAFVGV